MTPLNPVLRAAASSADVGSLVMPTTLLGIPAGIDPSITASDLHAHGGVFATEAAPDSIADIGRSTGRVDPTEAGFGANVFGSDGATTLPGGTKLDPVGGHNAVDSTNHQGHYFDRGTATMNNIESIFNGTDTLP